MGVLGVHGCAVCVRCAMCVRVRVRVCVCVMSVFVGDVCVSPPAADGNDGAVGSMNSQETPHTR